MKKNATIGVVADTHGLFRPELLEWFKGVDLIIHAGDIGNVAVLDTLRTVAPVHAVRGNADKGEWAEPLPLFELFEVAGHQLYLIHKLKDMGVEPTAAGIQVVISGHSHRSGISRKNSILYLNPGSAGPKRFDRAVTAALLRLEPGRAIGAEILTMLFINKVEQSGPFRLSICFDDGVTKSVNLEQDAADRNIHSLLDPEYFMQFSLDPLKGSLVWPNGERYMADKLYEIGIRCRMDVEEPTVEWYLSRFDEHLEGAHILFAKSWQVDAHHIPLFILLTQNGHLYKVVDEIIDWCDPACGAGWESIRQETSREKLLREIESDSLGFIDGKDMFASELQAFLKGSRI